MTYTVDGVEHTIVSEQPISLDVGSNVVVRYVAGHPTKARLAVGTEGWGGTIGSVIAIIIGIGGAITTAILGVRGVF